MLRSVDINQKYKLLFLLFKRCELIGHRFVFVRQREPYLSRHRRPADAGRRRAKANLAMDYVLHLACPFVCEFTTLWQRLGGHPYQSGNFESRVTFASGFGKRIGVGHWHLWDMKISLRWRMLSSIVCVFAAFCATLLSFAALH